MDPLNWPCRAEASAEGWPYCERTEAITGWALVGWVLCGAAREEALNWVPAFAGGREPSFLP